MRKKGLKLVLLVFVFFLFGIKSYADTNVNDKDEYGRTLIYYAKDEKIAKLLIEAGADVNIKDNNGITPLHYQRNIEGNVDVVKLLIEAGADVNIKNNKGQTLLHYEGNIEIVKALIEAGADVNIKDNYGRTPLQYAVGMDSDYKNPKVKIVELLIEAGANINEKDENEFTILDFSWRSLLDTKTKFKNITRAELHKMSCRERKIRKEKFLSYIEMRTEEIEILLKNGAVFNLENEAELLEYACKNGCECIVKLLLSR